MSTIKNFTDQNGNVLAHGAISDSYMTGASLVGNGFQHESVPFFITAHAIDTGRNIMIFGLSDEKYTTYKIGFKDDGGCPMEFHPEFY